MARSSSGAGSWASNIGISRSASGPSQFSGSPPSDLQSDGDFIAKTLAPHPLFCQLNPEELLTVTKCFKHIQGTSGQVMQQQGNECDFFYLLASGSVEVVTDGVVESEHATPGFAFGDLALLYRSPCKTSVRCKGSCTFLAMDRATFEEIFECFHLQQPMVMGLQVAPVRSPSASGRVSPNPMAKRPGLLKQPSFVRQMEAYM
mmetsp:Transcript_26112/g.60270  ORF Transcript_26112/g.60270 Transcript_26112/m.60270 type:complete len:203 (+) Transcript_26112:73-681(+)